MTEKTDIRDSDEKVVEIEMERLDKKKCSSQFTLSSDCIRRFCEKYREVIIPELSEPPVRTLGATIPENESHIFR